MVSFQCEGCGDVQTKKKLDSHWNQCRAPFSCIDCMTTFHGMEYKAHTSCMTEAQKYEGHLYRGEKPNKASKRKSVSILEPTNNNALVRTKHATVEDDFEVPPHVPTPPPAVKNQDSVFDYLVAEEDPNTPQIQFASEREEMFMKSNAPSVFGGSRPTSRNEYRNKEEQLDSRDYEENGFSYGAEPINPRPGNANANASTTTFDFTTPSAKAARAKLDRSAPGSVGHSRQNSNSEKKRKRAQTDDHHDATMTDAPSTIVKSVVDHPGAVTHSGLTGGLQRMLTEEEDDWGRPRSVSSPEMDPNRRALTKVKPVKPPKQLQGHDVEPPSPLKRTRRARDDDTGLGINIKGRAGKVMSMINGALSTNNVEGSVSKSNTSRRRASSSDPQDKEKPRVGDAGEKRERKKHKVTRHNGTSSANVRMERPSRSKKRHGDSSPDVSRDRDSDRDRFREKSSNGKQKAIEYHPHPRAAHSPSDSDEERARQNGDHQMIVFGAEERLRRKCSDFLEYVAKGPDSNKGYSINKVLKRYHKDSEIVRESDKREEEKDLWKGLRLKRNDRGEVVVFFA